MLAGEQRIVCQLELGHEHEHYFRNQVSEVAWWNEASNPIKEQPK